MAITVAVAIKNTMVFLLVIVVAHLLIRKAIIEKNGAIPVPVPVPTKKEEFEVKSESLSVKEDDLYAFVFEKSKEPGPELKVVQTPASKEKEKQKETVQGLCLYDTEGCDYFATI